MVSLPHARRDPAGREVKPDDQPVLNDIPVSVAKVLLPTVDDRRRRDEPVADGLPVLNDDPNSTSTGRFVFARASELNQTLGTGTASAPSAPTVVTARSSNNQKYIIGGAVGGGVLVLILLVVLLFCCRKRRAKRDLERGGGGHSEGQPGNGQFACCSHGTCDKHERKLQMGQKTPLKPFVLKSAVLVLTSKEGPRQHAITLSREDTIGSQKSAWSDTSNGSSYSPEDSKRGKRKSLKRPPPLKLTSLVTPVIHGPQDNPRTKVIRSSLPSSDEVPTIVVEPPRSETPERMKRK